MSLPSRAAVCFVFSLLLLLAACGGGDSSRSTMTGNNPGPGSPPAGPGANPPVVPPPPTNPSPSTGTVTVTAPANGASVTSPARFAATTSLQNVAGMRLYLDGLGVFFTFFNNFDHLIFMAPGPHTIEVKAWDNSNHVASTTLQVNVTSETRPFTFANIQQMPGWEFCSKSARGTVCAAGLGDAVSTMTQGQSSPSLSGASAKFSIGGTMPYSNALWWRSLGGGTTPSHFTYDLFFFIDRPDVSQALEFDVNQSFGGVRWTWGTECNFRESGKWDLWDPESERWIPSAVPCPVVSGNTWHHLVLQFERVGQQVHYVSLTLDGVTTPLNVFYNVQQSWPLEDIDIAFQLDGDFEQAPYNVWLDNVTLTAF